MVPSVTMEDFDQKWPAHVGDPMTCPEGDDFRKRIINPALIHVVKEVIAGRVRGHAPQGMNPFGTDDNSSSPGRKLRILDLGCGEGYLGRLLANNGYVESYTGVDRSPALLAELVDRAKQTHHSTILKAASARSIAKTPLAESERDVDLVFVVVVLEHLERPFELLKALSTLKPETICVAVTLNPHYRDPADDAGTPSFSGGSGERQARLPWKNADGTDATHKVLVHSHYVYERWFLDAGHVVHHAAALVDPKHPQMPAPFTLWVFSSMGTWSDVESDSVQLTTINPPMKYLESNAFTRRVVVMGKAPVLTSHMRGGCLWLVCAGEVTAYIGSGTPRTFKQGEAFGDIEAGWAGRDDYYQSPVTAGDKGCTLLVIPKASVDVLAKNTFDFALFQTLQRRLRPRLWRHPEMKIKREAKVSGLDVHLGGMVRLARALCLYGELERWRSDADGNPICRSPDGLGVYVPNLLKVLAEDAGTGPPTAVDQLPLRALVALGFVLTRGGAPASWLSSLNEVALQTVCPSWTANSPKGAFPLGTGTTEQAAYQRSIHASSPELASASLALLGQEPCFVHIIDPLGLRALALARTFKEAASLVRARTPTYRNFLSEKPKAWSILMDASHLSRESAQLYISSVAGFFSAGHGADQTPEEDGPVER